MREVVMPKSSMTMTEGEVTKWMVADGDEVREGDPIATILTDKVEMEVEAPEDGRVAIVAEEGTTIPVGRTIAFILGEGERESDVGELSGDVRRGEARGADALEAPATPGRGSVESASKGPRTDVPGGARERARPGAEAPRTDASGAVPTPRPRASPAARAMARRLGVDLGRVEGSGPRGRVRPADVVAHARPAPPPAAAAVRGGTRRYRPAGMRGAMARRMQEAASVPQFTLFADVPLVAAERARARAKQEDIEAATLTDVLLRAAALTLPRHEVLNSHYVDGEVVSHGRVHLGVAVDTDEGLVVPVIRDADGLDLARLSRRRRDLVVAARRGRLRPDDVAGATFTLTNLGAFGIDAFQPVVDPPRVGILAVGRMRDDPGRTATLALGADHRVVDGAQGARFLAALRELLEFPEAVFAPRATEPGARRRAHPR